MIIGINAVNINSGGGIVHITNILNSLPKAFKKNNNKNNKIIIWANPKLFRILHKCRMSDLNINIIKINYYLFGILWKSYFLYRELKEKNCDIFYALDGIAVRRFKKTIILFQNLLPFCNHEIIKYGVSLTTLKLVFLRFFYFISLKNSDAVIYLSKYSKLKIERQIGKPRKSIIIPHGVSKDFILRKKNIVFSDRNKINVIYISSIDLYKYQWNVVKAIELLVKDNINVKLHLVGPINNKSAENLLNKACYELNSFKKKTVILYGELNKNSIINLLKKMNVYLYASSCETFGISLLEGIASKLPVFSSNMSGLQSIFGNEHINYFNPENPVNIYKCLKKNFFKRKKINNVNKRELLKIFSWKKASNTTIKFISNIYNVNYTSK
jgi:glycosyltransferase involved in cell wall biosynthesis